jgi:excisionase family DNA binding protein
MTNLLMTPEEAARILGLSPYTVRRLLREGELPGRKVGKRQWRIRRVDLEEYLATPSASQQPNNTASRLEQLAADQGVRPITNFELLLGDSWSQDIGNVEPDEGTSAEEFLAPILILRENSPAGSDI